MQRKWTKHRQETHPPVKSGNSAIGIQSAQCHGEARSVPVLEVHLVIRDHDWR
jgi:hypothetical protein